MRSLILTLLILFGAGTAHASDVVIFDQQTGAVLAYKKSVHTPDYANRADALINPDIRAPLSIPIKYWRYEDPVIGGPRIVEMNPGQKNAADAPGLAQAAARKAAREAPINDIQNGDWDALRDYLKDLTDF